MTTLERFWSKVNKTEHCWEWTQSLHKDGYGQFRLDDKIILAHRFSYTLTYGDPGSLCVLHKCDNRKCVRPDHLFVGTQAENNADMRQKGRCRYPGSINPPTKLTEQAVIKIRERYARGGISQMTLAKEYGVTSVAILKVLTRKTWKHVR